MSEDLVTVLLDEICLEGLDGITIEDLWLRLQTRPAFELILDDCSKPFLWDIIKTVDDVDFYELPETRNPLVIFDRYKYVDPELGMVLDPDDMPEDIYPFHPIDDVENGIMGSCQNYFTRQKISSEIISLSYTDAVERYGRKLVMVGSQSARNFALMGDDVDPNSDLSAMHFCILERIGRSRYHGEITQGKISLQVIGEDPKTIFYHRKLLASRELICKQVHHIKTGTQNCSGSLLHLPRFYVERKPKALYLTEKVIDLLKARENYIAEYDEVRKELGLPNSLRKLFKTLEFQRFVRTDMRLPYRALHPDAKPSEWKLKNYDKERMVRVLQLIDPDVNFQEIWSRDDEFEESEFPPETSESVEQILDRSLLSQAYFVVEAAGPRGLSQMELAATMGQSKLQSRTICRNLVKCNLVSYFMHDIGRQRVSRFVARVHEPKCETNLQFNKEREKMMALAKASGRPETFSKERVPKKRKTKSAKFPYKKPRAKGIKENALLNADQGVSQEMQRNSAEKNKKILEIQVAVDEKHTQNPGFEGFKSSKTSNNISVHCNDLYKNLHKPFVPNVTQNHIPSESQSVCNNPNSFHKDLRNDVAPETAELAAVNQEFARQHQNQEDSRLPEKELISENSASEVGMDISHSGAMSHSVKEKVDNNALSLPSTSSSTSSMTQSKLYSDSCIITKIVESESRKRPLSGFNEDLENYFDHQGKDNLNVTYRLLRRANLIIECVKSQKVVEDLTKLMKMINEEEEKEGYNVRIDKKSLLRLLFKLSNDGYVKVIQISLKGGNKEKILTFACEPGTTIDHSVIQSAIEQTRVKFFILNQDKTPNATEKNENEEEEQLKEVQEHSTVNRSVKELTLISKTIKGQPLFYSKRIGKKYGFCPKFVRMRTLHEFLFYIIYGYEGDPNLDQEKALQQFQDKGVSISDEDGKGISRIFVPEFSWKTFVPPLPQHAGWPEGWALMCDILLRLPVSIFVKIFNITYLVPDMESYLSHPIRCHYLIKHLPPQMRHCLMVTRKYIFSIHDVMQRLCFIGLIRFGPQRLKEKDQVFIFLNRRANLLDTTPSKPGYHQISENVEYERQNYYFGNMADVDKYWYDVWNICLHTNLGGRICMLGKDIVLEVLHNKPSMLKAQEPVIPEKAQEMDIGEVPGDRKGAAGFDSAFFAHLKRNWNWTFTNLKKANDSETMPPTNVVTEQRKSGIADDIKKDKQVFDNFVGNFKKQSRQQFSASRRALQSLGSTTVKAAAVSETTAAVAEQPVDMKSTAPTRTAPIQSSKSTVEMKMVPPQKHVTKIRKITRRIQRKEHQHVKKQFYDDVDRAALLLMSKLRVEWSQAEDNLLLLCKVASMYLCPNHRQQGIGVNVIRDILHAKLQESLNKTSRACQRRILYVMKNIATSSSVALLLEELRQDPEINRKFATSVTALKKSYADNEEVEKVLSDRFKQLIDVLEIRFDKFKMKEGLGSIPDTTDLFWKKYEIICPPKSLKKRGSFEDVKNITDIHRAVINTIIHSSLCSLQDKTSWAYQLFRVYQQFPDNLLREAMKKIREDQMVSLKKNYLHLTQRKGNFMPLSCSPFQLSVSYHNLLRTRYQYPVYHQSYKMSTAICKWYNSTTAREDIERGMKLLIFDGGSTAALVELFCRGVIEFDAEIPEQVIILNPKVSELDESYARIMQRYKEILQSYKPGMEFATSATFFKRKPNSDDLNTEGDTDDDCEVEAEDDKNDPDYIPDSYAETSGVSCSGQSGALARTASRIALYMMREELEDTAVENSQHSHDFFVVNSCTVFCKLSKNVEVESTEQINKDISKIMPLKKERISSTVKEIRSKISVPEKHVTEEDIQTEFLKHGMPLCQWPKMLQIINFILDQKELGVKAEELKVICREHYGELPFKKIISFLLESRVAVRNGVTEVRYIHCRYLQPWLVNTHILLRLNRERMKPASAKGLKVGDDENEVIVEGERRIKRKMSQVKLFAKKRKIESSKLSSSQNKLRKVQLLINKAKLTAARKHRNMVIAKAKQLADSLKEKAVFSGTSIIKSEELLQANNTSFNTNQKMLPKLIINENLTAENLGEYCSPEEKKEPSAACVDSTESHNANRSNITENIPEEITEKKSLACLHKASASCDDTDIFMEPEIDLENANISNLPDMRTDSAYSSDHHLQRRETEINTVCNFSQNDLISTSDGDSNNTSAAPTQDEKCVKYGEKIKENTQWMINSKRKDKNLPRKMKIQIDKATRAKELTAAMKHFDKSKSIQILIRPWVRINGTLNKRILDRMLGAVLGHCMYKPGNTIESISNRFSPALQPLHVRELVEILWKIGCVKLFVAKKSWPVTLFSPPSHTTLEPADGTEDDIDIVVDPQYDAITRLGQFIGKKTYAKDFLSC